MKNILKIAYIFVIILITIITISYAAEMNFEVNEEEVNTILNNTTELLKNETINTDLILTDDDITLNNNVNGNIYLKGEIINISSEIIDGDIFVFAEEVTIDSNVNGNVYAFSNNLNVSGNIKDIYFFGENINLGENTICRDLKVFASNINIEGIISRDLYAATGEVNLSKEGKIRGTLSTTNDNLDYQENINEIILIEDITEKFKISESEIEVLIENIIKIIKISLIILSEITGLIIITLILLFSSKKSINNSIELKDYGLMDTVYGFVYVMLSFFIMVVLILTVIGIPISIMLGLILLIVCWKIAIPMASIQFAKTILKQENKPKVLVWIVAFIIFTFIQMLGYYDLFFGGLIKIIISLYGLGYIIRNRIRKNEAEDMNQEISNDALKL